MKILEGEIDLRDETRVAEQNRQGQSDDDYKNSSIRLGDRQAELRNRTEDVTQAIRDLPESAENFSKEIGLLSQVSVVMTEAEDILRTPETGDRAIAAETEAIELLLEAKRQKKPNGGGGGGSDPGGGGSGDTEVAALALVGTGLDIQSRPEETDVRQSTGMAGPVFPEEFKRGLDEYFQKYEQNRAAQ